MKSIVIISGPCGSGKSTIRNALDQTFGDQLKEPFQTIEVDALYQELDPTFQARNHLEIWKKARENTGELAKKKLSNECDIVFVFGNTLFSNEQLQDVLHAFNSSHSIKVYHITLNPTRQEVAKRLARRQKTVPDWLDSHLAERAPYVHAPWTVTIDNSSLSPEETAQEIYHALQHEPKIKL